MKREELEKQQIDLIVEYLDKHYFADYRDEVINAFNEFRNACVRYGFEKGRESAPYPEKQSEVYKWHEDHSYNYESAEEVIAELDKEQDV